MRSGLKALLLVAAMALLALVAYQGYELAQVEVKAVRIKALQQSAAPVVEIAAPATLDRRVVVEDFISRPLFESSRRPGEAAAPPPPEEQASAFPADLRVLGTIIDEGVSLVMVQQGALVQRLKEGDTVAGWRVERVHPDHVRFASGGDVHEVALFESLKVPASTDRPARRQLPGKPPGRGASAVAAPSPRADQPQDADSQGDPEASPGDEASNGDKGTAEEAADAKNAPQADDAAQSRSQRFAERMRQRANQEGKAMTPEELAAARRQRHAERRAQPSQ